MVITLSFYLSFSFIDFLFGLAYYFLVNLLFSVYHPLWALLFSIDIFLMVRNAFATLQMLLVAIQVSINDFLFLTGTLRSLNRSMLLLSGSLQRIRLRQQQLTQSSSCQFLVFGRLVSLGRLHYGELTTWLLPQVDQFMLRHGLIVRAIESLNRNFVAPFFLLALLTNVPISVSLHSMLLVLYERLAFFPKLVVINMLALQTAVALVTLLQVGRINKALYASEAPLFTVQSFLLGSTTHLRQKLKLLSFFEFIVGGGRRLKVGYTVGSLANICSHSLFMVGILFACLLNK